jgi:succinate dehydrogenase / fumarate reductase cytochrome b subunit
MERPLSPHLGIYRWQITNTLSIVHRMTGVTLSLGAVILTAWLIALAGGPEAYLSFARWAVSPLAVPVLFAFTFSFFYHLCNGIRHLFWDAGYGFNMRQARASGIGAVAMAVMLTLVFWLAVMTSRGS